MKKLSELSDETLLYIEIFNDLKNIIPEVKVVTKKNMSAIKTCFAKGIGMKSFSLLILQLLFT